MPTSRDLLLTEAAAVACELSSGQADALAYEIGQLERPGRILQVAGLAAPGSVDRLCELWIETEAIDPASLADAIQCAAAAVKSASSYEKVELLWTGPEPGELRRNLHGLLEVIRSARHDLWVVSYLVGVGVDEVLHSMQERAAAGVNVRVLIDHRLDRYQQSLHRMAAEAPDCQILVWPDEHREIRPGSYASLHAKCAIADGRQAFVSSANLTGWAMGENLEVGYLVTGGATPSNLMEHFDQLASSSELQLAK